MFKIIKNFIIKECKMLKKFFIIISIIASFQSNLVPADFAGEKTTVAYSYSSSGNPMYAYGVLGINIGYKYDAVSQITEIDRTMYCFNLGSIPGNATITSVQLKASSVTTINNGNLKYKITQISNLSGTQNIWQGVEQGSVLYSEYLYTTTSFPNNSDLVQLVNNNKGGNVYLGAMSLSENNNQSGLALALTLQVFYTTPPPPPPPPPTNITIYGTNNFQTTGGYGEITIDGNSGPAPLPQTKQVNQTATLEAIPDQIDIDNYQRVWANGSYWKKTFANGTDVILSNNTSLVYTTAALSLADDRAIYKANFKKLCNVTVQRNNPYGGIVKIIKDGVEYTAPASGLTKTIVEQNPITVKAEYEMASNYINYDFQSWQDENGQVVSTQPTYTFSPGEHTRLTAVFRGLANTGMMDIQANVIQTGQYPTITWTDNPNDAVSYRIYSQITRNWGTSSGIEYPIKMVASVPKGTQRYQCTTQVISGTSGADLLCLKVAAFYNIENTEVTVENDIFLFNGIWMSGPDSPEKRNSGIQKDGIITKYAVANYPNPFNPTTTINYQVPESGHVTLKVYDIMGKEIATLVDGVKNRGSYNVNFSMEQYRLASGIYFCRLSAGKNMLTTKMILSK
jgi:hypothetical protein